MNNWIKAVIVCCCVLICSLALEHLSVAWTVYQRTGEVAQTNIALQQQLQATIQQANQVIAQLKAK